MDRVWVCEHDALCVVKSSTVVKWVENCGTRVHCRTAGGIVEHQSFISVVDKAKRR